MKNLNEACQELCDTLTEATHTKWEHTRETTTHTYKVGQKYIKIIICENGNGRQPQHKSVWGFINKSNPNFKEGDILKSAGWTTPALNKPRGNLLEIDIKTYCDPNSMRIYGPDYLR